MPRISSLPRDESLSGNETLVGTDTNTGESRKFILSDVKDYVNTAANTETVALKTSGGIIRENNELLLSVNIQKYAKTFTASEMLALNGGTKVKLIDAPGANKVIVPVSQSFFMDFNSVVYNFSKSLTFYYGSGTIGFGSSFSKDMLNDNADRGQITASASLSGSFINEAIFLGMSGAGGTQTVTQGDSPVTFLVLYYILDLS